MNSLGNSGPGVRMRTRVRWITAVVAGIAGTATIGTAVALAAPAANGPASVTVPASGQAGTAPDPAGPATPQPLLPAADPPTIAVSPPIAGSGGS